MATSSSVIKRNTTTVTITVCIVGDIANNDSVFIAVSNFDAEEAHKGYSHQGCDNKCDADTA